MTKTERCLLGIAALFLAGLLLMGHGMTEAEEYPGFSVAVERNAGAEVTPQVPPAVNINTAAVDQLQTLQGIGPVLAGRIVEYREEKGTFASVEELQKVPGIGQVTLERIRERITVTDREKGQATGKQ